MHGQDQEAATMRSSIMSGQAIEPLGLAGTSQVSQAPGGEEELSSSVSGLQTGIVESPTAINPTGNAAHSADGMLLSGHEARAFPGIFTRNLHNYKM